MKNWLVAILVVLLTPLAGCKQEGKSTVVYPSGEDIHFKVMSFNVLFGGTSGGDSLAQTVAAIEAAGADIVAIQEHVFNGPAIAKALGWDLVYFGVDNAIVSRYNIVEKLSNGVVIEFNEGHQIALFDVHLAPYPYGPYDLRDNPNLTAEELISSAQGARGEKISKYIADAQAHISNGTPVFFVGDFNEPSHLDWTDATVAAGIRPLAVEWPTSKAVAGAGFTDIYRSVYSDPVTHTGYTWTPKPSANEVHDRIDFIYMNAAQVNINSVSLVGPGDGVADIIVEPYPSDHRGVVADLTLPIE